VSSNPYTGWRTKNRPAIS